MKNRYGIIVSVFLAFTLIFSSGICMGIAGASPSLMIEPSEQISLEAGETFELALNVDELPEGLSGYILTVELDDPAVARIENVDFPDWASLNAMSELSGSSVWLKAADLQNAVGEGAKDTELASLTLKGLEGGSTGITVTVSKMDDDSENAIILEGAQNPDDETGDENPPAEESSEPSRSGGQSSSSMVEIQEDAVNENPEDSQDEASSSPENEEESSEDQLTSPNPEKESIETANVAVEDTGENALTGFGFVFSASIFMIMAIVSTRSSKFRRK